jgi:hypothetical protein
VREELRLSYALWTLGEEGLTACMGCFIRLNEARDTLNKSVDTCLLREGLRLDGDTFTL